jgi:hypothetical protein
LKFFVVSPCSSNNQSYTIKREGHKEEEKLSIPNPKYQTKENISWSFSYVDAWSHFFSSSLQESIKT